MGSCRGGRGRPGRHAGGCLQPRTHARCARAGGAAPTPAPAAAAASAPLTTEQWRAKHEADYRRDFVTIAGLFPLKQGANTAGSAPGLDVVLPATTPPALGRFVLNGQQVRFEPAAGVNVMLRGTPVSAPIDLKDDRTRDVDELVVSDVRIVVHTSGDSRTIRVRDPQGAMAKEFLGFAWFDIDPAYRVVGRFVADAQPQKLKVLNTFGDVDGTAPRASSSSSCREKRCGCGHSPPGRSASISYSRTRRAGRKPTRPRASSTPICSTMGRWCSTSTRRTTRRAPSIPIRPARFR